LRFGKPLYTASYQQLQQQRRDATNARGRITLPRVPSLEKPFPGDGDAE
jgi:hypothetical protein